MANIATRGSVLAIVPEVTEGTLVAPSSANQYTKVKSDAAFDSGPTSLENEELSGSIGVSKPVIGISTPSFSFSKYLRASGTAGTAPDFNDLLKAFFGSETANGTERTTDSGSTTTVVNVAAGTGSDFPRGSALLVKDPTNGTRVRAVHSRNTDAITLGFALPAAPASGVSLGKCVYYTPASSGHQTVSVWFYRGNPGVVQAMAGGRVTEFSFEAATGEFVDASFVIEGTEEFINPIEITSSTEVIDFEDDDGDHAASVAVGFYNSPVELAAALQAAMRAAQTNELAVVEYLDASGKFKLTCPGSTTWELKWNTGANTASTIGTKIGFAVAADDTGQTGTAGYTSDNAITVTAPHTPSYDSAGANVGKNHEVMIGLQADYQCFNASQISFNGQNGLRFIESLCAETGRSGSVVNGRSATVAVTALLEQYQATWFERFREGTEVRFQYAYGPKSGGTWVAGSIGYLYLPTCVVTSFNITDEDGLLTLNMELTPFVDSSGNGEMYAGFV